MNEHSSDLQYRLDRVEKELRFWRYTVAASALLLLVAAASSSDEIVAKKITITGAQDQALITIGSWHQGAGGFIIVNSMVTKEKESDSEENKLGNPIGDSRRELTKELHQGGGAAILGLPGRTEIELLRKEKIGIDETTIGPNGINISTGGGRLADLLASDSHEAGSGLLPLEGSVGLRLIDSRTEAEATAVGREVDLSLQDGVSVLGFADLSDRATTTRADLGVDTDGTPRLHLLDRSGRPALSAAVIPSGEPAITMSSNQHSGRLDLHITEGQPRIDLRPRHDEQQNPAVSLLAKPDGSSGLIFSNKEHVRTAIGVKKNGETLLFP